MKSLQKLVLNFLINPAQILLSLGISPQPRQGGRWHSFLINSNYILLSIGTTFWELNFIFLSFSFKLSAMLLSVTFYL